MNLKMNFKIKPFRAKIIFMMLLIIAIFFIIAVTTYALREDITGNEITNEKQLIKMGALLSMGEDTNTKITKNALSAKLDRYLGTGKTTIVIDTDRNVLRITYLETGREYEIEMATGYLGTLKMVTFNANGGEVSPTTKRIAYGIVYGELPVPTREGYTFAGWWTNLNRGVEVTETSVCDAKDDEILYAKWTPNQYIVTLEANGGNVSQPTKTVTYDSAYGDFPSISRDGYTFSGWFTELSGGTLVTSETIYNIVGDSTLYAHWTANSYTVTFNANGGNVGQTSKSVTYDSIYGDLPDASRTGYTFNGWYTEQDGGNQVTKDTKYTIAGDSTLYAHWTVNTYTVTFDANGGGSANPSSKTVTFGSTYGDLASTSRTGYTFDGWYTSDNVRVTSGTVYNIADNITLYAHWTANTYTISYSGNGNTGGSTSSHTVTYDQSASIKSNGFSKTGYTFVGWTTNSNGTDDGYGWTNWSGTWKYVNGQYGISNGKLQLYARWSANTYTIAYNGNGNTGGSTSSHTVTYDQSASIKSNGFTRTGHVFVGWTTNSNGSDDGYGWTNWSGTWKYVNGQYGISNGKLQLYARWEVIPPASAWIDSGWGYNGGAPNYGWYTHWTSGSYGNWSMYNRISYNFTCNNNTINDGGADLSFLVQASYDNVNWSDIAVTSSSSTNKTNQTRTLSGTYYNSAGYSYFRVKIAQDAYHNSGCNFRMAGSFYAYFQ